MRRRLEPAGRLPATPDEAPLQGFFKKKQSNQLTLLTEQELMSSVPACKKCGLDQYCFSPKMPMSGEGRRGVFILGEAPGADEDRANKQFVGKAGELFFQTLRQNGFHLERDAWKINAVNCRPTDGNRGQANRPPTAAEIKHCRPWWWEALQSCNPNAIWLVGGAAIEAFLGNRRGSIFSNVEVSAWHKLSFPDPVTGAWVYTIYHPSYFNRMPRDAHYFEHEIKWLVDNIPSTRPLFENESRKVQKLTNYDEIIQLLNNILEYCPPVAIDFETNCLRPWKEGAKVASCAISTTANTGTAFPIEHPAAGFTHDQIETIKGKVKQIGEHINIPKVAQSIQMENAWMMGYFGCEVNPWIWDTMIASHVIDCRDYFTKLKKQVFLNWGCLYSDDIEHYLTGSPFNKVFEAPLPKLLEYNAMDAMFTYRLWKKQEVDLVPGTKKREVAFPLFLEGVITSSRLEKRGIPINVEHYHTELTELEKKQVTIERNLLSNPACLQFETTNNRLPSLTSSDDLKVLLFEIMRVTPTKFTTKTQQPALDEEVLEQIDKPFTKLLLKSRKYKKIQDYIAGFLRLQSGGLLHPNFNLHTVKTYRSSSSDPNFQNLPKRLEIAEQMIRRGIVPAPGQFIMEVDYGSMEVRIICCYSRDPVLAQELQNNVDIHQYWSDRFHEYGITRYDSKNGFVFPLFYGSSAGNVHTDLVSRGYRIPLQAIEAGYHEFWDKYHYTKEYRQRLFYDYELTGKVQTMFGFERTGLLRSTQIINTPVQAAAFHCLQWSLNKIDRQSIRENWQSQVRAQIHDSMWFSVQPEEFDYVRGEVERVMTLDIREEHPWIIVPLLAEFEVSQVDGNWSEMTKWEHQ